MTIKSLFLSLMCSLSTLTCHAEPSSISLFPLEHYNQNVSAWVNPTATDYDKPLLEKNIQQQHFNNFFDHYFGSTSPWNPVYVNRLLRGTNNQPNVKMIEQEIIGDFTNTPNKPVNKISYGENFRPYTQSWIDALTANINLAQFDNVTYQAGHRGIAIDNLHARVLPTDDPYFYHHTYAGEGYPFDYLQMSSLWAGTPIYILLETKDHAWSLVITPDYVAWVKSTGIAKVDNTFVTAWQTFAKQRLAAITQNTNIITNGIFRFAAYIGSVFPAKENGALLIPVRNIAGNAEIHAAILPANQIALMPLSATPHNFSYLMNNSIGRTYGWGNMYFYNDCSAELKGIYTPFGIWLARHSSRQIESGRIVNMTPATPEQRLAYLLQNGHKFMTIIYIGGHVVMYIGNYPNPNSQDHEPMAMIYQNAWGMHPADGSRRAVLGQSHLLPILLQYPEDSTLASAASNPFFQVSYLDTAPNMQLLNTQVIDLKALMYP